MRAIQRALITASVFQISIGFGRIFCQAMYMLEYRISFDRYSAICFFEKISYVLE